MNNVIRFFVPGAPVPQQRAKTIFRDGKVLGKYDPPACKDFKNRVALIAFEKISRMFPADTPLDVEFTFYLPRPASVSVRKYPYPVKKPDWDNLGKGVADAMENIVYARDSQIVDCVVRKRYADDSGEHPAGLFVTISAMQ